MISAALPADESKRLNALIEHNLLDTLPEKVYDDIAQLAAAICGTPIAAINLIADNRQWPKAVYEVEEGAIPMKQHLHGSRDASFCAHTILNPNGSMVVPDARYDERFFDNPFTTTDPHIVFYAGVPVKDAKGHVLGSLCVIDSRPRELSEEKLEALESLAKLVNTHFELRHTKIELERLQNQLTTAQPILEGMVSSLGSMQTHSPLGETGQLNSLLEATKSLQHVLTRSAG